MAKRTSRSGWIKASKKVETVAKVKPNTVKEKLATLSATIQAYFSELRYRRPEYTLQFEAILTGENGAKREHMVNVPTLIASIVTAQGLGKEIRVRANTNRDGGTMFIDFYSPVTLGDKVNLLS